jgi:FlaA1/EpsC-like NDP-sugar epimerase
MRIIIITSATGVVGSEMFAQAIKDPAGLARIIVMRHPEHAPHSAKRSHRHKTVGIALQMSDSIYGRMIRVLQTSNGPRGPLEQAA